MRVLGFAKKWPKIYRDEFTTFRFPRKDTDWKAGEEVQIVFHNRRKDREFIRNAKILRVETYLFKPTVGYLYPNDADAEADGFDCLDSMLEWFYETYGNKIFEQPINKLTLEGEPMYMRGKECPVDPPVCCEEDYCSQCGRWQYYEAD